jgi:excisionase family DNA binding protein
MRLADAPDLLTPKEVGALLRISKNLLYSALKVGSIPSIRIGNAYRIPKRALLETLQAADMAES